MSPKRLAPAFEKVRAAVERDDLRSADLKKLASGARVFSGAPRLRQPAARPARPVRARARMPRPRDHRAARVRPIAVPARRTASTRSGRSLPMTCRPRSSRLPPRPIRYLSPSASSSSSSTSPSRSTIARRSSTRLPLPLVLVGCAGSGKTALTLTRLRRMHGDVLYVTQSAFLAESAASLYFAHGYENPEQSVDFLSFRKLLESIEVPKGRAVIGKGLRRLLRAPSRAPAASPPPTCSSRSCAASSRLRPTGPLTRDAYLALGVRQSMYGPPSARRFTLCSASIASGSREAGLYDPSLLAHEYRSRAERRYDAVVVDEIQDLTNAELALVLATLEGPAWVSPLRRRQPDRSSEFLLVVEGQIALLLRGEGGAGGADPRPRRELPEQPHRLRAREPPPQGQERPLRFDRQGEHRARSARRRSRRPRRRAGEEGRGPAKPRPRGPDLGARRRHRPLRGAEGGGAPAILDAARLLRARGEGPRVRSGHPLRSRLDGARCVPARSRTA